MSNEAMSTSGTVSTRKRKVNDVTRTTHYEYEYILESFAGDEGMQWTYGDPNFETSLATCNGRT
jgi:hypothetical protein